MRRAAEMGYAPAHGILSASTFGAERVMWAQKAAAQQDRCGLNELARCFARGWGCAEDEERATELYGEAAELGHAMAQFTYGETAFGTMDLQRFFCCGEAAKRGYRAYHFCDAVAAQIPGFDRGENGRILHVVSGAIRDHVDHDLCEAMLRRARLAIDCWSVVDRRLGVAKERWPGKRPGGGARKRNFDQSCAMRVSMHQCSLRGSRLAVGSLALETQV
jgi:hypothetical protein